MIFCYFRSCTLVEDVLIGADTEICDNTTITKTMIGNNCKIGNNVTLVGSQIMDHVTIKDNSKIINSFIDNNCVVNADSLIENGTIVAENVNINAESKLKGAIIECSEEDKNGKSSDITCNLQI